MSNPLFGNITPLDQFKIRRAATEGIEDGLPSLTEVLEWIKSTYNLPDDVMAELEDVVGLPTGSYAVRDTDGITVSGAEFTLHLVDADGAGRTVTVTLPSGGEDNVNADWNATSGDAEILNKPTIPTVPDALTDAEIKTQYEANADTNAFTDADHTKLDGIEEGAAADQTGSEIVGAIDTELGNDDWQNSGTGMRLFRQVFSQNVNVTTADRFVGTGWTIGDALWYAIDIGRIGAAGLQTPMSMFVSRAKLMGLTAATVGSDRSASNSIGAYIGGNIPGTGVGDGHFLHIGRTSSNELLYTADSAADDPTPLTVYELPEFVGQGGPITGNEVFNADVNVTAYRNWVLCQQDTGGGDAPFVIPSNRIWLVEIEQFESGFTNVFHSFIVNTNSILGLIVGTEGTQSTSSLQRYTSDRTEVSGYFQYSLGRNASNQLLFTSDSLVPEQGSATPLRITELEGGGGGNVQSDWDATSGDAEILNKPTIPSGTYAVGYRELHSRNVEFTASWQMKDTGYALVDNKLLLIQINDPTVGGNVSIADITVPSARLFNLNTLALGTPLTETNTSTDNTLQWSDGFVYTANTRILMGKLPNGNLWMATSSTAVEAMPLQIGELTITI